MKSVRVFISYAHVDKDAEVARKLFNELERIGVQPWLDEESLLPGQNWRSAVNEAIEKSDFFIALLSSRSVNHRGFVQKELKQALDLLGEFPEGDIFVIPVRLDDCKPRHKKLGDLYSIEIFSSWEVGFDKIVQALKRQTKSEEADGRLQSRKKHKERVAEYVRLHPKHAREVGFHSGDDFLDPTIRIDEPYVECMCTALSRAGVIYLILPSAGSEPDNEGVGRTAITARLLGLRPPYTELMGIDRIPLKKIKRPALKFSKSKPWRLIASDMAYLRVSEGQLSVIPVKAEKVNFLWDLARHLFRTTDLTYSTGAHRDDPKKRKRLEALFRQLPCEGLSNIYADLERSYRVDEILILRRKRVDEPGPSSLSTLSDQKKRDQLKKSILLSSNEHGSDFWNRPRKELVPVVEGLINQVDQLPPVKELVIHFPGSNVPSFLYHEAAEVVNTEKQSSPLPKLGSVLLGVDRYRGQLFNALYTASKIRMLVTTGEKVFQDGAFWRQIVNLKGPFRLEILMLDPESPYVAELWEEAYFDDYEKEFLKEEIETNIKAIRKVRAYLKQKNAPITIHCRLYQERPNLRMTLIDGERALIAHYFPGRRTGSDTLFFDVYGPHAGSFLKSLEQQFKNLKKDAKNKV